MWTDKRRKRFEKYFGKKDEEGKEVKGGWGRLRKRVREAVRRVERERKRDEKKEEKRIMEWGM